MCNSCCVFSAPFTIQRLCELLVNPQKHYKTMEKFLRAVEKVRAIRSLCLDYQLNLTTVVCCAN